MRFALAPIRPSARRRRAAVILYALAAMMAVFGFCSLAVDFGRVQLAKTELQCAADAAARAGARSLFLGNAAAISNATAAAADNKVDGAYLVLQPSDVQIGSWKVSTHTFTPGGAPSNAIQVTAQKLRARGTAIPLCFGAAIGQRDCDIHATAVVTMTPTAFVGYSGMSFWNNVWIDSYDPTVNPNPTHATANGRASIGSNSAIVVGSSSNMTLSGNVLLGPSGSVSSSMTINGSVINLNAPLVVPADPPWAPGTNPGGVAQNYSVPVNNTVLPGGTYWFTSFTAARTLSFSGPVTLYVNGNISVSALITPYNSRPGNLKIYQLGVRTFNVNTGKMYAYIIAPRSSFSTENNFTFYGSALFDRFDVKNNTDIYYDETLTTLGSITTVK